MSESCKPAYGCNLCAPTDQVILLGCGINWWQKWGSVIHRSWMLRRRQQKSSKNGKRLRGGKPLDGTGIGCLRIGWIWKCCKQAEFQKWQDSHKCKAEDGKGAFIVLLTEVLAAAGALFNTARQELEPLQWAKDAEAQAVAFENHSFVVNWLLGQLETNLRPLSIQQLEQEPTCLVSREWAHWKDTHAANG